MQTIIVGAGAPAKTLNSNLDFQPVIPNPHIQTILGNFWPRKYDFSPFASESHYVQTEPDVQVLVQTQRPPNPRGEVVLLHGLEGSGEASYIVSLAHRALTSGFTVHRFHMRTCGGTEHLCQTLYHAGLSSDLIAFLIQNRVTIPVFVVGFSLGGNVVLKGAAEAGSTLLAGVCSVSAPIDLAASARAIERPENYLYQDRFVKRMKERLLRTGRYTPEALAQCRTIYEIDDRITAPGFGLTSADNYYETQSALRFVPHLSIPVLMIASQDDTLIPFAAYLDPAIQANPCIELLTPKHGGHLGFVSRRKPRFWVDDVIVSWIERHLARGNSQDRTKHAC